MSWMSKLVIGNVYLRLVTNFNQPPERLVPKFQEGQVSNTAVWFIDHERAFQVTQSLAECTWIMWVMCFL